MKQIGKLSMLYAVTLAVLLIAALWCSRTVTVLSEQAPINRSNCMIIDAGHGGVDGGATSCTGKLESSFNLEIALKLEDLMHFLGYETKMIRREDISVYTEGQTIAQKKVSDLKERVRICNNTDGAILLSIHQNTYSSSRYSGAQVFYAGSKGSEVLARAMQSNFIKTLNPGSSRQEKPARGIYLMEHIRCPGVLIECGFLSNPEEEAKLRSREYQQQICCVIAACAVSYANT